MTQLIFPTERQVCRALLNAIATHRDIQNARIYYPVELPGVPPELIPITKFRTHGALELREAGLTLSVYPLHSSFDSTGGVVSNTPSTKSIRYPANSRANSLGRPTNQNTIIHSVMSLVVQLNYRDATLGDPVTIASETININDLAKLVPYGYLVSLKEDGKKFLQEKVSKLVKETFIEVEIIPGEEILRDWIPILRGVIRDIQILYPFSVRNPVITAVDYPTSNPLKNNQDIVFHTAYIIVEYDLMEPERTPDYELPIPTEFTLIAENIPFT